MRKILSLILVLVLCASMMALTTFAAETGSISVSSAEAERGETVSVNVSIKSNPGIAYLKLTPSYDTSALTLVSMTGKGLAWTIKTSAVFYATDNTTYTGTVLTLTFKVADNAAKGSYKVSVAATAYDEKEQSVSFGVSAGSVNVVETCKHSWGAWKTTKEATCGAAGTEKRTCSLCGASQTRSIAATGNHTWGEWTVTTAATCCAAGEEAHTCSVCGTTETREVAATGLHAWGDWTVVTAATCSAEGVQTRVCADCGEVETGVIEKLAHAWGEWESDGEKHWHTCSACGHTEIGEHDFVNGVCSICGAKEVVEAKPFPWWIILIVVVVVGGVGAYFYFKKKK